MTGVQTCALPICFPVTIRAAEKPKYIRLEFEEKVSPEEVNEIQFLTNNPKSPTLKANTLTKLGDSFVFERTDPKAPGIKEPDNPREATNIYMYKVKTAIKIAYNQDKTGFYLITMPDNQQTNKPNTHYIQTQTQQHNILPQLTNKNTMQLSEQQKNSLEIGRASCRERV